MSKEKHFKSDEEAAQKPEMDLKQVILRKESPIGLEIRISESVCNQYSEMIAEIVKSLGEIAKAKILK